jgi:ribosome-associated translation inhibitor RaiA
MRLVIKPRGVELTDELRAFTARRIHFALSRAADVVRRVDVTLADVNGPRGGVDKVCRIRLAGRELPEIIVEERDASLEVAVAVAAGRMSRAVLRALDRSRAPYARAAAGASRYARSEAG